ncbi:hypothetical protein FHJ30_03855 [Arthrobacter sp. BB-1]|uniref:hypothetical protein n=1 Tax=Micrococcaceae TaxID=1268 RepID=UPI0010F0E657|nr:MULTISPECIES: hypothetical protein [Micrococcaceae]TNB75773.1 hypothetical protein FHJ30_03855 [Arthrobacter sp. BB-1]UEL29151.1 hypothetical protein KTR40_03100 [Pseudarthrobacter sp. L1SW]VII98997.1 hypothetical protein [Arthrobacter sp. DR-2P]
MRRSILRAFAAVFAGILASVLGISAASAGPGRSDLAAVRQATVQYHNVDAAIAAGYEPLGECVPGMGYHYVNLSQFGRMDPLTPDALTYAANSAGHLRLVAAEWFKVDLDQNLATDGDRPSLFGKDFDGPMLGHAPGMPIHYDLHAYLWQGNPDGVLATYNPKVSCP